MQPLLIVLVIAGLPDLILRMTTALSVCVAAHLTVVFGAAPTHTQLWQGQGPQWQYRVAHSLHTGSDGQEALYRVARRPCAETQHAAAVLLRIAL